MSDSAPRRDFLKQAAVGARGRDAVGTAVVWAAIGVAALAATRQAPAVPGKPPSVLTATVGPRQGGWTRSFNPFRSDAESRWPTWSGIYEPLLISNRATGTFTPWLATAYAWSADSLTFRVTTRPGVLWSDGQPFTALDVAFTFDLMHRFPALDHDAVWLFLESVTARDAQTVEFKLKRPYTPGAVYLGEQAIVPEHKWKDVAQPATFDDPSPVATGPFVTVKRFEPTVYELGRNPTYWQPGKPGVDVLRVPLYRTNAEIVKALLANEVDWASLFFPDIEKEWVATDPAHHQYWYPDTGPTVLLYVDTRRKPFDDRNVRKALSMALDRPRITKDAMGGYAPPADATGLAESQKRWKDATLAQDPSTRRNVAEANKLLDAASLARGADGVRVAGTEPMRYTFQTVQGWTDWLAAAEIMRQNLAEVGVAVTVKAVEYNAWDDALRRGRFDVSMGFGSRGPTPYEFYRGQMDGALVRPTGERAELNFHRFADPEAEKVLRRFEATSDAAEALALAVELQRRFVLDAPSIPLFIGPQWGVFNTTRLTGFPSRFRPYANAVPTGSAPRRLSRSRLATRAPRRPSALIEETPGGNPCHEKGTLMAAKAPEVVGHLSGEEIVALCRKHTMFEWSAQTKVDPIPVARAEGVYFWTPEGKRYLDFNSQLMCTNIGHSHPKVVKAIQEQAATLAYANPFMATEVRARLGAKLAEITPGDIDTFFFTNGGAEAVENAIRVARVVTGRHKILVRYRSYHGGTAGALTLTGDPRRWASEPGIPGVVRIPDFHRWGKKDPEPVADVLRDTEDVIRYEGGHTIAAVIVETVVGTNGILIPPDGYMQGLRKICDAHGILLIADEVMAGFGRTGRWFAIDHWGVVPDLMTMAKGLTSAYVQLGALGMRPGIARVFQEKAFPGGLTYNSHPLACAAALATLDVYEEEGLIDRARMMGEVLNRRMAEIAQRHPSVGTHRNIGLFGLVELVRDRKTYEPMALYNGTSEEMAALGRFFREKGLYTFVRFNTFFTNPPLVITEAQLEEGLRIIDEALSITDKAVRS